MYDICSQLIIEHWTLLENKYDIALMTLYNKKQQETITISNNNCMKFLDIIRNDSNKQTIQQHTHIHSFVNDMIADYGGNIFSSYVISCDNMLNKKRKHNHDNEDNKKKRNKYE